MIKVMIVDDEYLIRYGIIHSIPWEENGFIIVGEAENGEEALEKINELKPHILVTDIKMPVMDGLELIRRIREKSMDLFIIILTCYDDFKYAQQALHYDVEEYLLKLSSRPEDILGTLLYVKSKIDYRQAEQRLKSPKMKIPSFSETKIKEKWGHHCGYLIFAEYRVNTEDESDSPDIFSEPFLSDKIEELFKNFNLGVYKIQGSRMVAFVETIDRQEVLKAVNKLYDLLDRNEQIKLTIGISSYFDGTQVLGDKFEEAKRAKEFSFYGGLGNIYWFEDIKIVLPNISVNENEILRCFENQSEEALSEYFSKTFKTMLYLSVQEFINLCVEMVYSLVRYLKKNNKVIPVHYRNLDYWLKAFSKYDYYEELVDAVFGAALELIEIFRGSFGAHIAIIARIKGAIEKNYAMDLTLDFFSKEMNISYSYLSNLFRKEIGNSFKDYLNIVRINNAKELLKNIQHTIYAVSEKVGYSNPYYFSKVFKKYTGMAPIEYKNKFGDIEM